VQQLTKNRTPAVPIIGAARLRRVRSGAGDAVAGMLESAKPCG